MLKSCDNHDGVFMYEGIGSCPICDMQTEIERLEEIESAYVEILEKSQQ